MLKMRGAAGAVKLSELPGVGIEYRAHRCRNIEGQIDQPLSWIHSLVAVYICIKLMACLEFICCQGSAVYILHKTNGMFGI